MYKKSFKFKEQSNFNFNEVHTYNGGHIIRGTTLHVLKNFSLFIFDLFFDKKIHSLYYNEDHATQNSKPCTRFIKKTAKFHKMVDALIFGNFFC